MNSAMQSKDVDYVLCEMLEVGTQAKFPRDTSFMLCT